MTHPAQRLDAVVHQPVRLGILTVLSELRRADFGHLKDALGLSDGNLSSNLQKLEETGHLTITKFFEGKRPRTWLVLTEFGRCALEAEVAALREIVAVVDAQSQRAGPAPPGQSDHGFASSVPRTGVQQAQGRASR